MKVKRVNMVLSLLLMVLMSCIEPFETQGNSGYETVLVVDANITNEIMNQQIYISRTIELTSDLPMPEVGANVEIITEGGNSYSFSETSPGTYTSVTSFGAMPNTGYRLSIETRGGKTYQSKWEQYEGISQLDSLYAERVTFDMGVEGMAIYINSADNSSNSGYFRYEYEESYKIIAPFWTNRDLKYSLTSGFYFEPRPLEEQTCYQTDLSADIIVTNTQNLSSDALSRFLVRFISRQNYILSHRYSILVRQYVHSATANQYFETLKQLSEPESLFSETQPGFLIGNIISGDNPGKKVIGYFEVSSVSEKRIFFDYDQHFPGERLPEYPSPCRESTPRGGLITAIEHNLVKFYFENVEPQLGEGPYIVYDRVCGDCTVLGNPEVPDFWIE